jgi:flagellar capping protein FliD
VVHRHNGTEENKSVDLSISEWKESCGKRIAKERLNVNHSEKQIQNRIKKIVDKYNEIEVVR